jgi:predicted nucleic acid-binding protein
VTRMRKGNRLSPAKLRAALDELDAIWLTLDVHEMTDRLIQDAAKAARDYALRAYDAVHLAGALSFAGGKEIAFACWDHELSEAADKHGFTLIPEQS